MFECINFNILRDWTENQPFQHMKYEAEKDKYQKKIIIVKETCC